VLHQTPPLHVHYTIKAKDYGRLYTHKTPKESSEKAMFNPQHLGTQEMETERLFLRKFKKSDARAIYDNWSKDPENVEHLRWKAHQNLQETCQILEKWLELYSSQSFYMWCITLKGEDVAIGNIAAFLQEGQNVCEVAFVLSKKYWNRGIMTESFKSVIDFLFNKVHLRRIISQRHTDNPASGRVMEKCGLTQKCVMKMSDRKNTGEPCDSVLYEIENPIKYP
jgi:ribosomal-protein-alanine N-acetyltransferase